MKLKDMKWEEVLQESNPDVSNSILQDKILSILNSEAPMKVVQQRTKYTKWLTDHTKECMRRRDMMRDTAIISNLDTDWAAYRSSRNECTTKNC